MMRIAFLCVALWTFGCGAGGQGGEVNTAALMDPKGDVMKEEAPAEYTVLFETSAGDFKIQVTREWAPHGADRFYNLVRNGYYNQQRFFRVVPGFVVQWGMHGDPEISKFWQQANFLDDPVKQSNKRGRITFAKTNVPNTRTTQVFINFGDNLNLDGMGFAPFGEVVEGMDIVDAINAEYGQQPSQGQIAGRGNPYLEEHFPNLDYIVTATIAD
jgi:peptidyl-prolyl cis-trans isomerase A (cyclophilin A)